MNFFSLLKRKLIYNLKRKTSVDDDGFNSTSLDNLFHYYGSDKANLFKLNNTQGHGFSKFYVKHLENIKNKQLNILEIGSYSGSSAVAFTKYLSKSKIFCFDINISKFKYKSKKIDVYGVDIKNKAKVKNILDKIFFKNEFKNFDLIIDDGSHKLSDILLCLNFFFSYLKKDGIYIIEDYKYPNYFDFCKDVDDILVDDLLVKLKKKEYFKTSFFKKEDQEELFSSVGLIKTYKGNLRNSDICFILKI